MTSVTMTISNKCGACHSGQSLFTALNFFSLQLPSMFAFFQLLHMIWCPETSVIWSSCSRSWRQTSHCSASSRSCLCRLSWSLWSRQPGNKQTKQPIKVWTIILFKDKTDGTLFLFWIILFFSGALTRWNSDKVPGEYQRTSPSRPRWFCRCRAAELQRKWCVRMGRFPEAWARLAYTQTRFQRSRSATDHEGSLLLYTVKTQTKNLF